MLHEFKHALKWTARRPWYFAVAVLILALGTGVTGAVFSLINAVLLRPIAGLDPGRLVRLYARSSTHTQNNFSYPDYLFYRDQEILKDLASTNLVGVSFRGAGSSFGEVVSSNYFSVLGLSPRMGRTFASKEDGKVLLISDRLWERMFRRSPGVLGNELIVNNEAFTVIGVVPAEFTGTFAGASQDVWVLAEQVNWLGDLKDTERPAVHLLGRLVENSRREAAEAALTSAAIGLEEMFPRKNPRTGIRVASATLLHGSLRKGASIFLTVMLLIAGLVLVTACANLANIALMHATGRRREIAIRTALGAGKRALLRQFAAEGLLLSMAGGAAGLLVGRWAAGGLFWFNPIPSIPLTFDLTPDWRVIAFQLILALVTGVVLGFIPALYLLRSKFLLALKEESAGATSGAGQTRVRGALWAAQVAVSLVLLICAGLFLMSLQKARLMDPGFQYRQALATDIDLDSRGFTAEQSQILFQQMLRSVAGIPGVESVTLADLAPLDIATARTAIKSPDGGEVRISSNVVGTSYFQTLRIPLLEGREFTDADRAGTMNVAIINETMARRYWQRGSPLGMPIQLSDGMRVTVVGVARDVKYRTLSTEPEPHLYLPFSQSSSTSMTLLVRTAVDPESLLNAVQQEIPKVHPSVQGFFARTLEQHVGFALLPARLAAVMSAILGSLTLILAAFGIYGSAGYSLSSRTREIGIRMALGARPRDVRRAEIKRGMILTGVGLCGGVPAALALARAASGLLYGVSATEPLIFGGVTLFLSLAAFVAVYIPANRAARLNPAAAIRS